MRLLVTGGAGYIGSVTTALLVETGHEVLVFDNLSRGHRAAVHRRARLVVGELADAVAVDAVVGDFRPDCVLHFAALIEVGESVKEPGRYFHNNVACGINLLNACCRHRVPRFVFSSTAAVYGNPEKLPLTEESPLQPVNPYGSTKFIFERLLVEYEKACGLRHAVLRYFNIAGAHLGLGEDHRPESHLIPRILRAAAGETFEIYGDDYPTRDGTCVRDYVHVADLARAHLLAMEALAETSGPAGSPAGSSLVYNLGSESGYTNREVFAAAEKVLGTRIPVRVGPRRPGDAPELVASAEKARRELGWRPEKTLEQMIADALEFHQRLPDGYPD